MSILVIPGGAEHVMLPLITFHNLQLRGNLNLDLKSLIFGPKKKKIYIYIYILVYSFSIMLCSQDPIFFESFFAVKSPFQLI